MQKVTEIEKLITQTKSNSNGSSGGNNNSSENLLSSWHDIR